MNSKWTMRLSYGLPALALDCALALVAIVKRLVCYSAAVAVLLPIVLISSSVVAFADSATTEEARVSDEKWSGK